MTTHEVHSVCVFYLVGNLSTLEQLSNTRVTRSGRCNEISAVISIKAILPARVNFSGIQAFIRRSASLFAVFFAKSFVNMPFLQWLHFIVSELVCVAYLTPAVHAISVDFSNTPWVLDFPIETHLFSIHWQSFQHSFVGADKATGLWRSSEQPIFQLNWITLVKRRFDFHLYRHVRMNRTRV